MFDFLVRPFRKKSDGDAYYYRIVKDIFGFRPGNIELYKLALIHKSASVAMPDGVPFNNERLEFLGDAVLEAIVSDYLFIEFPQSDEGFLTQMRSKIVSRSTLNDLCVQIGLSDHIISQSAGYSQKHLHGDALEAIIGAIYLDKGYDFVNRLIINDLFARYLDLESMTSTETDYKSRLIEWCQKGRHSIRFDTRPDSESSSHSPKFRSVVIIDNMEMGYGFGFTKKEAEQNAALSVSRFNSEDLGLSFLEMVDKAVAQKSVEDTKNVSDNRKVGTRKRRGNPRPGKTQAEANVDKTASHDAKSTQGSKSDAMNAVDRSGEGVTTDVKRVGDDR